MYVPAICLLALGIVFLILNLILFFRDYKDTIIDPKKRKKLYVNGVVLLSTISLIVLATVYLFMINNQL